MDWSWLPKYLPMLIQGVSITIQLLVSSMVLGLLLAIPIGLVQVTGPKWLAAIARGYCTVMRGTPLLIQLYLFYYGVGSILATVPELRQSFLWPILREGYFYAVLAFALNEAGYAGEIMRGAFLSVPKGELEAARSFGMSPWQVLRRVWLPRAVRNVLPTLGGETILTLKSTPLAALVTVVDLFGAADRVRQETYIIYPPLLLVMVIYMILTFIITRIFAAVEKQIPVRR
ncbi:MAG: ABC transporter permease [Rhizobiales bacterium]|nr:ABC transporter permease [Hyphomicrobiales bacterium]